MLLMPAQINPKSFESRQNTTPPPFFFLNPGRTHLMFTCVLGRHVAKLMRALRLWIFYACRFYLFVCYLCVAPTLSFERSEEVCYSCVAPTFSFEWNDSEVCLLFMCGTHTFLWTEWRSLLFMCGTHTFLWIEWRSLLFMCGTHTFLWM